MNDTNQLIRFDIAHGRRKHSEEVPARSALLGSGAHCDVQLPPQVSDLEQLFIEWQGDTLTAQLLSRRFPCTLAGQPFDGGALPEDAELHFGDTHVRIRRVMPSKRKPGGKQAHDGWPWPVRIVALVGIAISALMLLRPKADSTVLTHSVPPPELFSETGAQCPVHTAEEGAFVAQRLLRDAHMQHERAPFFPHDGVEAVLAYRTAAACFELAQQPQSAARVARSGAHLQQVITEQFHVHQVRLERFLQTDKNAAAQREVKLLQDFLRHQQSAYTDWLSAVERELRVRFGSAALRPSPRPWRTA